MERRELLSALGAIGITTSLAGCKEKLEPDESSEGSEAEDDGKNLEEHYSISSEVQLEAAQYLEEINKDVANWDEFEVFTDKKSLEQFLSDPEISESFKDEQLRLWLDLPEIYREEDEVLGWRNRILNSVVHEPVGELYRNDWSRDGVPHVVPEDENGDNWTTGPAADDPLRMRGGHNPGIKYFYNVSGRVHDPKTGEHLGFQPEQGDKVGLRGDKNGDGNIVDVVEATENAEFVEDLEPSDLDPEELHTFLWIDYIEKEDGDGHRFPEESLPLINEMFQEKVPPEALDAASRTFDEEGTIEKVDYDNGEANYNFEYYRPPIIDFPDSTEVNGINFHPIKGTELPFKVSTSSQDTKNYIKEFIPEELRGPVNYIAIVNGNPHGGGGVGGKSPELDLEGWGILNHRVFDPAKRRAIISEAGGIVHEAYGHGVAGIVGHPEEGETIMNYDYDDEPEFLTDEWKSILSEMPTPERRYSEHTPIK